MKIEKITISNINSLAGTFTIDLTEKSISKSGIFCITGPTGSGKSTILDAICFAMYRATPRVNGVSPHSNELMSKGCKVCGAEVIFSHNGKRYKVLTAHRRTREGANTPFAQPEQNLCIQTAEGNWQLISNQLRGVEKELHAITGLTMQNFTRSVMLPQGKFSEFMRAKGSERAEILSTITHTEDYERIGNYVHQYIGTLKAKKDRYPDISTLSVEERAAKEKELEQIVFAKKKAQATIDALNKALKWLDDCARAKENVEAEEKRLQDTQAQLQALKDSGAEKQIAQAKAAKEVQPVAATLSTAQATLADCLNKLQPAESAHTEAAEKAKQAANYATQLCDSAKAEQAELQAKLRNVDEHMRKEESELNTQRKMVLVREQDAGKAQENAQKATSAATKAAEKLQKAQRSLEQNKKRLAEKQADAALEEYLPQVEAILALWQDEPKGNATLPPTAELQSEHARVEKEIADILQGRTQQELISHSHNLANLASRADEYEKAASAHAGAEEALASAKAKQAALPGCDVAEQKYQALSEKVEMLSNIQSIDEKLKSLYNDFAAGNLECCPCCGSTTPTKSPHDLYNSQLKNTQELRKQAEQELKALRKQHQEADRQLSGAQATLQGAYNTMQAAEHKLSEALRLCGFDAVPEALAATIEHTEQQLNKLESLQEYVTELQSKLKPAELRDKLQQALLPCTTQQAHTLQEAVALVRMLRKSLQEYRALSQQVTAEEQELNSLRTHAENTAKVKEDAVAHSNAAYDEWKSLHAALEQAQCDFNNKWGAGNTAAALATSYQNRINQLSADMKTADDKAKSAKHAEEKAELALNNAKARIAEAEKHKKTAEDAMQQALAAHGFSSEADFRAAALLIPTAAKLEEQLTTLNTARDTRTALLERERKAHRDLQAQQPELANAPVPQLEEEKLLQTQQLEQLNQQEQTLSAELRVDDIHLKEKEKNARELEAIESELNTWSKLKDILGGTSEGFKLIAQQYTFDMLIKKANIELAKLSQRFKLKRATGETAKDGLGLNVIDYEHNSGEERSCNNLSGGESFIVSMALALGLSKMASDTQIDTLFLDEGFGTLDSSTLAQVLNSLGTMCGEGKTIGIISHVEQISEQVRSRLELKLRSGGFSTIEGCSAVKSEPMFPFEQH